MKIPFKKKLGRSENGKGVDISKENFQTSKNVESNTNTSDKNTDPVDSETNYEICLMCNKRIPGANKKPDWRWNLESSQPVCIECYERKAKEYEKITNYCRGCNKKLGFIRYNPKPPWGISGQLCRSCWDLNNSTFKK